MLLYLPLLTSVSKGMSKLLVVVLGFKRKGANSDLFQWDGSRKKFKCCSYNIAKPDDA